MPKKTKKVTKPKIRKNDLQDKAYFKDVAYLVEATHFEQFSLWREFHYRPGPGNVSIKNWKDEGAGFGTCIGEINDRPICVQGFYSNINGKRVMFISPTSMLVDYDMVERWIEHNYPEYQSHHCDGMNFHLCLQHIGAIEVWRKEEEARKACDLKAALAIA